MNPNNLINIQGQKFGRWTVLEKVKVEYTLPGWSENLNSYLRSAMSYTGNRTLVDFRTNTICQVISDSTREKLNNR